MVQDTGYKERLAAAMKGAGVTVQQLADDIGVTYQAVKKVLRGATNELSASNNAKAAAFLKVDSDWLALGAEAPDSLLFSLELVQRLRRSTPAELRRAENTIRAQFDMEPLPRLENGAAA